jgi:hypothetical protein
MAARHPEIRPELEIARRSFVDPRVLSGRHLAAIMGDIRLAERPTPENNDP